MKPKSIPSQGNLIAPTQGTATPTIARTQTSQKKIEANRQNALLSTGPKTERGKKAVSRNALKYGLFAKEIIITRGEGAENPQEFLQLLRALHEGYKPVGAREMLLVEEIATCIWRKRRVLRFEMGEIQKRLNSDAYLQPFHKLDEVNRDILILQYQHARGYDAGDKELSTEEWFQARQRQQSSLLTHPVGIQYVRLVLMDTKAEIQKTGSLSSKSFKELMATVGYCDKSLTHACSLLVPAKSDEIKGEACDPRTEDNDEQTKLADRKVAIELLDRKLESLESLLDLALENDRVERNAQVNSLVLPNDRANDKVLRSEARLDRQRYRAMAELERLQRRREGENVPPPLNVNLGRQR